MSVGSAAIASLLFDVPKAAILTKSHTTTPGIVTSVDTANHGVTTVRFNFGNATYSHSFGPTGVQVGETVLVHFDPRRPTRALLQDPRQALMDGLNLSAAGGLYLGTGFTAILFFRTHSRQREATDRRPGDCSTDGTGSVTRREWLLKKIWGSR
jgi:hypothetical protein